MSNPSPSLQDGFNGARDAEILSRYDWDKEIESVHVQATAWTKPLLKRAGIAKVTIAKFYAVRVIWDPKFKRLQLAPIPTA